MNILKTIFFKMNAYLLCFHHRLTLLLHRMWWNSHLLMYGHLLLHNIVYMHLFNIILLTKKWTLKYEFIGETLSPICIVTKHYKVQIIYTPSLSGELYPTSSVTLLFCSSLGMSLPPLTSSVTSVLAADKTILNRTW